MHDPVPVPEGVVDFTKRVKNISVRYLSELRPTQNDLDDWIVLPLYQQGQDIPIDNDGKTSLLLANVAVMQQLLTKWEERMQGERVPDNETVTKEVARCQRQQRKRRQKEERRDKRRAEKKLKEGICVQESPLVNATELMKIDGYSSVKEEVVIQSHPIDVMVQTAAEPVPPSDEPKTDETENIATTLSMVTNGTVNVAAGLEKEKEERAFECGENEKKMVDEGKSVEMGENNEKGKEEEKEEST